MTGTGPATGPRFCRQCGSQLIDGRCPVHEPGSEAGAPPARQWWVTGALGVVAAASLLAASVAAVLLLASVNALEEDVDAMTAILAAISEDVGSLDARLADAESAAEGMDERTLALDARLNDIEQEQAGQPELTALAVDLRDSVVTVVSPWGQGSGFPIRDRGGNVVLLTNYHVIEDVWVRGGREVEVRSGDGTFSGEITSVSLGDDLAVINPAGTHTPLPVRTGESSVGESVVAVGSPQGLEGTVSTGIISAIRDEGIQFTAPVTFGNSGGPLVDEHGRVIGVVTWGHRDARAAISFAVPMEVVCTTVTSCQEGG